MLVSCFWFHIPVTPIIANVWKRQTHSVHNWNVSMQQPYGFPIRLHVHESRFITLNNGQCHYQKKKCPLCIITNVFFYHWQTMCNLLIHLTKECLRKYFLIMQQSNIKLRAMETQGLRNVDVLNFGKYLQQNSGVVRYSNADIRHTDNAIKF